MKVLEKLAESDAHIQFLATTHSPLVLASLESLFDEKRDAWFDVDLQRDAAGKGRVVFEKEIFEKMGNASNWLQSRAFDLKYPASLEAEKLSKRRWPLPTRRRVRKSSASTGSCAKCWARRTRFLSVGVFFATKRGGLKNDSRYAATGTGEF